MRVIEIDETTKLPLRIVAAVVVLVFSAATWMTTIFLSGQDAHAEIKQIKRKLNVLSRVDHRLYRLELKNHIEVPAEEQMFESNDEQ